MESTDTITTTKPKRQYRRKAVEVKLAEMPVEVKPVEIKPAEIPEIKPVEVKSDFVEVVQTKKKKSKRNIDPNKMTYLKAFSIWKQKNNYTGLSPKRGTDQHKQIMEILNEHKNKKQ